jgi:hypothetical protein
MFCILFVFFKIYLNIIYIISDTTIDKFIYRYNKKLVANNEQKINDNLHYFLYLLTVFNEILKVSINI